MQRSYENEWVKKHFKSCLKDCEAADERLSYTDKWAECLWELFIVLCKKRLLVITLFVNLDPLERFDNRCDVTENL